MNYRLICILEKSSVEKGLDIEICLDTGSKTLSPFQRKVTVSDLLRSEHTRNDKLVQLLYSLGYEKQPFNLSVSQLAYDDVKDILFNQKCAYLRSSGKNRSLKRINSLMPYLCTAGCSHKYPFGRLIGGELYINNLHSWWNDISVKLRYENTSLLFPSYYSNIPFKDNGGAWIIRDKKQEDDLLSILGDGLDDVHSVVNFGEDPDRLKSILQCGWKLFVPKDSKTSAQVSFKSDKSGIEWFATGDDSSGDLSSEMILRAYLNGRNYEESNGSIKLFTQKTIKQLPPAAVTKVLACNIDAENLYADPPVISKQRREEIFSILNKSVNATLKSYQIDGVLWLNRMRAHGTGCLLADDMGLGKTLQVLAFLTTVDKQSFRYLVVCPASITSNWENEILRFTPQLLSRIDIASYEAVRIHPEKYDAHYDTLIIDEGQMVKNDDTQRHQSLTSIVRQHTVILTGTPIENSIKEIWSQFQLLIPESGVIERKLLSCEIQSDSKRLCELSKSFLSPFILRRTKEEVLTNLPDVSEENIYIELSDKEQTVYTSLLKTFRHAIETGVSGRVNSIALEGLLRLRQCCVSVNLLPKNLSNSKYVESTKMSEALRLIRSFISENHKVLLFSQFTSALDELQGLLNDNGVPTLYLSGSTHNRQAVVDKFQNDAGSKVFLISLKAGGTGLNLTAADRVIFIDDWWNPAVENQAFSRAHRIGQKNNVEVYRIICKNTIEEKILELHKNKKEISDMFNMEANKLTIEQIKELLI